MSARTAAATNVGEGIEEQVQVATLVAEVDVVDSTLVDMVAACSSLFSSLSDSLSPFFPLRCNTLWWTWWTWQQARNVTIMFVVTSLTSLHGTRVGKDRVRS